MGIIRGGSDGELSKMLDVSAVKVLNLIDEIKDLQKGMSQISKRKSRACFSPRETAAGAPLPAPPGYQLRCRQ